MSPGVIWGAIWASGVWDTAIWEQAVAGSSDGLTSRPAGMVRVGGMMVIG